MAIAGIVLILILLLLGAAARYFFRYTFLRSDKPDPWNDGRENKIIFDRAFFERSDREAMEIVSRDGLRLKGWLYDRGADTTVILFHGYRGGPEEVSGIASHLYEQGFNILLIYQRAHELSEGSSFTMGCREKLDAADWARAIAEKYPDGKIVLYGWSMGGNTVMGAVGEDLPENVRCAVEDCGYCDLDAQLLYSCERAMPKLPCKGLLMRLLDLYCRLSKGFSIYESRTVSLGRCRIPMLFIHGTADVIVPYENLDRCYDACAAEKRRSTYRDIPHVGSCGLNRERYFGELDAFIRENTQ